jgi:indolepyruvate ferredoxin oxidoreductase beta subunit
MPLRVIIAGVGGQGVVYATKVLAQAALLAGLPVTASENHGMSQRGGSVLSHLKLGAGEAPLIRRGAADWLLALDRAEALRNLPFLRRGGRAVVNLASPFPAPIAERLAELDIHVEGLDAAALARTLGLPAAVNLIVLGRAAQAGLGFSLDDLKAAVQAVGPERSVPSNWAALEQGALCHAAV